MSQIAKKFISANAIDGTKILLTNNEWLRALNSSAIATNIVKLSAIDKIEFATVPMVTSGTPSIANDLVTKAYVDSLIQGIKWKQEVQAVAISNVALSGSTAGLSVIFDGITPTTLERYLLASQTDARENGIYVMTIVAGNYTLARTVDMDISTEFPSSWIPVAEGALHADAIWGCTVNSNFILGTDNATFTRLLTLDALVAGNGVSKTGVTIDVNVDTTTGTTLINGSDQVAVQLNAAGAVVTTGGSGIRVNLESANPTLQIASNQLGAKLNPTGAIATGATGLAVKIEVIVPTLQINGSNQLGVKLDAARAITTAAGGVGVNLESSNPTLQIATNQLGAKLDGSRAITTGASGLGINLESADPTLQLASNQLGVKLVPAGAIVTSAAGVLVQLEASNATLIIASNRLGVKYSATTSGLDQDSNGLKVKIDNTTNLTTAIDASGRVVAPSEKTERKTLIAGDITSQFIDLAFLIQVGSANLYVSGVFQRPGLDYTLSVPGSVTRVTFAGDLATGGPAALVSGDILEFTYRAY